jgi:membrane protein DedA with SNARE-associated domain
VEQWITDFLDRAGYAGVALLMLAENVFPPIPSELIMPLAGYAAARGAMKLPLVVAAGTFGSVLGALPWYFAGRWLGTERLKRLARRHGRWLTLSPSDVDQAQAAFDSHCGQAVLLGRLVPAVRTLISAPAGIARMSLPRFLAYSAAGSAMWSGTLAAAGHALGADHARVARYMGPVSNGIVVAGVIAYLWRVVRWSPERST